MAMFDRDSDKKSSNITIRYYRPEDLEPARRMFAASFLYEPGNACEEGMAWFATQTNIAYYLFAASLIAVYISSKASRDGSRKADIRFWFWCCGCFVMISSALVSVYFHYHRRAVQRMYQKHVKDAMEKDLKDPVAAYDLRRSGDLLCFEPNGTSGFWVAEDGGEVIGCIALKVVADPATGEVWRFAVSPTHRRRGVGGMLMTAVTAHAQAHGLRVLKLFTSEFNKAATVFYLRKGWIVERTIPYPGFGVWWRFVRVLRKELVRHTVIIGIPPL